MVWSIALFAAILGYLLGSVSFARVISRIVSPSQDIASIEVRGEGSDVSTIVDTISATTVSIGLGRKLGFLTFLLDIAKAGIPTLILRLAYPASPYYLIFALAALVGHNWPIYYRFRGGRGFSVLYGGLIVINWPSIFVTTFGGMVLSALIFQDFFFTYTLGLLLLIPWLWFLTHDVSVLVYAIAVNIIINIATVPELNLYVTLRRQGKLTELEEILKQQTGMWKGLISMGERLGLRRKSPKG